MARYFEYGDAEVNYLRSRDKRLAAAIDAVGHVHRKMDEGSLFSSIVHQIVGQQVSSAAQATVWGRLQGVLGEVTPRSVDDALAADLQACGMTFRKVGYIQGIANRVESGEFDLDAVERMPDEEAIMALSSLPGVGRWTAEMLLLFNLGRPDILSYGDLAIQRGMRMVYHHRKVTCQMFERYRRRYSPHGSVASLYLWEISRMEVPGYDHDFAPRAMSKPKQKPGPKGGQCRSRHI